MSALADWASHCLTSLPAGYTVVTTRPIDIAALLSITAALVISALGLALLWLAEDYAAGLASADAERKVPRGF